jgi:hypothetical protein
MAHLTLFCRYLAKKFGKGTNIYPEDIQQAAEAGKWMDWCSTGRK